MFYRIIHTEPTFPREFSADARDCCQGLLRVREEERLGSGVNGARDIMATAFFSCVDFDALNQREISPPFVPDVRDELDTKYVPKAYLKADAKDSIVDAPRRGDTNPVFEEFTFTGDSVLDV